MALLGTLSSASGEPVTGASCTDITYTAGDSYLFGLGCSALWTVPLCSVELSIVRSALVSFLFFPFCLHHHHRCCTVAVAVAACHGFSDVAAAVAPQASICPMCVSPLPEAKPPPFCPPLCLATCCSSSPPPPRSSAHRLGRCAPVWWICTSSSQRAGNRSTEWGGSVACSIAAYQVEEGALTHSTYKNYCSMMSVLPLLHTVVCLALSCLLTPPLPPPLQWMGRCRSCSPRPP